METIAPRPSTSASIVRSRTVSSKSRPTIGRLGAAAHILTSYLSQDYCVAVSDYTRQLIISEAERVDEQHGTRFAEQCRAKIRVSYPAIDADAYPCDIIGPIFYEDDVLAQPLPITGGTSNAMDGAGWGVALDDEKIEKYRVK